MSKRRKFTIVAVLGLVLGLIGASLGVATAQTGGSGKAADPLNPSVSSVQYSVKFVCGWLPPVPPDLDQHAKPGDYATSINIHNYTTQILVEGSGRVALFYRNGAPLSPISGPFVVRAYRYRTVTLDCVSIWGAAGLPPGSFIEGFVHLGFPIELPVSAVYTSQTHDDPNAGPGAAAGHSIDVENYDPINTVAG